jgi:hypothetical protein
MTCRTPSTRLSFSPLALIRFVWCFLVTRIVQILSQGFENLIPRISRLSTLNPLAISVTWGAGGSTRDRSIDLAGLTQSDYGIDTVMHLTCTNMHPGMVDDALRVSYCPRIQSTRARVNHHPIRLQKCGAYKIYSRCVVVSTAILFEDHSCLVTIFVRSTAGNRTLGASGLSIYLRG